MKHSLLRAVVFMLAFLSFACLLGEFAGLWSMRVFGCWVLPPAALVLAGIAWRFRGDAPQGQIGSPWTWIVHGALGGLVAACAYDLFRLPFVLNGAPLFKVFARFGELLLGSSDPRWLAQTLGWTYHFSNGAALGVMFLAMASAFARPRLFSGAIAWALFVECMLLLTPYSKFFGLAFDSRFLALTASAHLVFGIALGAYLMRATTSSAAAVQQSSDTARASE